MTISPFSHASLLEETRTAGFPTLPAENVRFIRDMGRFFRLDVDDLEFLTLGLKFFFEDRLLLRLDLDRRREDPFDGILVCVFT